MKKGYKQISALDSCKTYCWLLINKNKCIAKMWEKHLKKKVRKGPASLLKISLWGSSVSACANQPPGFSVSRTSTPNGLFQTIKILKLAISYFSSMWKFRDLSWHKRKIYCTLKRSSVLFFLALLQLLECLNGYICGHNLIMKFPPYFYNYTGLNGLVNSFS